MQLDNLDVKIYLCCGGEFTREGKTYKPNQFKRLKFCSIRCRGIAARGPRPIITCEGCGKQVQQLRSKPRRYCSTRCALKTNGPRWKGPRINKDGYRVIRAGDRILLEHRHVVEVSLGRPLNSYEMVHHINHNKLDNRLENLQLVSGKAHAKIHGALHSHLIREYKNQIDPLLMISGC